MNQEELEILKKAKEIQLKQNKILEEQTKEQHRLKKLKIKLEKEEQNKIKQMEQIETQKREAIKKAKFDNVLPEHLKRLEIYDSQIKEAEISVRNAQQNVKAIENEKYKFMRTFHENCVHSYGSEYYKGYDRYKKCIYCSDDICTHEMSF